ncbi:MAG: YifB family Mg chelatase-like AAA ATPase [Clostridia bacterium]|nr:YifB family Mg chelatase-like AAA ATPase [Clostridia bacterium]
MLATVKSFALDGLNGYPVDIEVDTQKGVASFDIVGLPSSAVKESRNRVRAAIKNSYYEFAPRRTTVNMAPADLRKEGSSFDLPIAIAFLASTEQIGIEGLNKYVILGELSLDGGIRRVNGVLPILISSLQQGFRKFIIPQENAKEASFIQGIEVYTPKTLAEACAFLGELKDLLPVASSSYVGGVTSNKYDVDLKYVKGQKIAKRALEIAVAGGHNILMCGTAGAGKTLLAKCVPTIMPDMTFEEAIETTKIHSVAGVLDSEQGMVSVRPFRSPHHTASLMSLVGGGNKSTCGEVSLAHNGVLFLDEMPEYNKKTLETLRQPLEDGVVTVTRVARSIEYPARFMLVASMNPCPCGNYGSRDPNKPCVCTYNERRRYQNKISGPLLDRIDLYVSVGGVEYDELRDKNLEEDSITVKSRVEKAREIQRNRFKDEGINVNAAMNNRLIDKYCELDSDSENLLKMAFRNQSLSARSFTRILKVARTIADLGGREKISLNDVAEAIQYKTKDLSDENYR